MLENVPGHTRHVMGFELVLRCVAAIALVATALRVAACYRRHVASYPAMLLCCGLLGYLLAPYAVAHDRNSVLSVVAITLATANPPLIWLVARGLFRERANITCVHWGAIALAVMIGVAFSYGTPVILVGDGAEIGLARLVPRGVALGFLFFAILEALREGRADLVEPRRRLRSRLVSAIAVYAAVVTVVEVALRGESAPVALQRLHVSLLTIVVLIAAALVISRGDTLFGGAQLVVNPPADPLLAELDAWIARRGFLIPGQSIKQLARTLGTQEYKLRRLLNGQLGFRNYNDFLHQHRIREACDRLVREGPKLSILELSFDVGYGSLATFNRAFKDVTGVTPTEYRLRHADAKPADSKIIS